MTKNVKTGKNGRVELLRFLFAIMILMFHIQKRFCDTKLEIGHTGYYFFNHGNIGVEFFFIVSGYLLAASCYKKREQPTLLIGTETAEVMWKKIAYIFPYHIFAMILTIGVNCIFLESTAEGRIEYIVDSWASIFFIQIFGFESTWGNKLTWYLDVWIVVSFLFYYFLRKHYDVFVKIVCPLVALCILGWLDHEYGSLGDVDEWTGYFYKCFLRGLAEMALGCSAYSMTRRINQKHFSKIGKKILALVELVVYLMAFGYACNSADGEYQFPTLFLMCIGLILTFSEVNPCHQVFDKPIFTWLGKYSLLIYLNQFSVIRVVEYCFEDSSFIVKAILCTAGTFAISYICDVVVAFLLKKKYLHKLMTQD